MEQIRLRERTLALRRMGAPDLFVLSVSADECDEQMGGAHICITRHGGGAVMPRTLLHPVKDFPSSGCAGPLMGTIELSLL